MLVVKVQTFAKSDVELGLVSIGPTICHGHDSSLDVTQTWMKFILKAPTLDLFILIEVRLASLASPFWITALDHKSRDKAMELGLVEEMGLAKFEKILAGFWSLVTIE